MKLPAVISTTSVFISAFHTRKALKADAVQMAHHVMNDVSNLYNVVSAEVVFIPQSRYYVTNKGKENIIAAATAKARCVHISTC